MKKFVIFLLTVTSVLATFTLTAYAEPFNPSAFWSSDDNHFSEDVNRLSGTSAGSGGYRLIMYDNSTSRYLCVYSSQVLSSSFKGVISGTGSATSLSCYCSYLGGGDSQGTWAIQYDPITRDIYVADNNNWVLFESGRIDNYYTTPNTANIGLTNHYQAITNVNPIYFSDSVNNFWDSVYNNSNPSISSISVNYRGILDEIVMLLPIVLGVVISFLAIRKGLFYLQTELRGA